MSFMNFWNAGPTTNSSGNLYSLFSERNMIKSGTYKKLLRSYYGSLESESDSSSAAKRRRGGSDIIDELLHEKMYPTVSKEAEKANSDLTSGISSLRSSVSTLQKEDTFEDTENGKTAAEKVVAAMKTYVSDYNNVVTSSKNSTLSNKTAYVANMMSTTSKFESQLAEIGVMLKKDGTLQLDETKLKNTDVSKVQKLFSSENIQSYGSTVASRLQFAGGSSSSSSTNKTEDSTGTDDKKPTGTGAAALKTDGEALASSDLFAKIKDKDGKEIYDIDKILSTAKSFVSNYNTMFDKAESSTNSGVLSNLSYIRERTANNTKALKEFGFSVDKKGRLSLDADTFKKADMSKVQSFFKDYGSYIASTASRVEFYMNTKANAASGYTSKANYNIPSASDYNAFI